MLAKDLHLVWSLRDVPCDISFRFMIAVLDVIVLYLNRKLMQNLQLVRAQNCQNRPSVAFCRHIWHSINVHIIIIIPEQVG